MADILNNHPVERGTSHLWQFATGEVLPIHYYTGKEDEKRNGHRKAVNRSENFDRNQINKLSKA